MFQIENGKPYLIEVFAWNEYETGIKALFKTRMIHNKCKFKLS